MATTENKKENKKEREARTALEGRLAVGEALLGYTSGNIAALTSQRYHVGLTPQGLILLPLQRGKPGVYLISIRRENIKSLKYSGLLSGKLKVELPCDGLDIAIQGRGWHRRAKDLALAYGQAAPLAPTDSATAGQRHLAQVRDFQALGFLASAQQQLDEATRVNPALSMDPAVSHQRERLAETWLAFRVAAGFLFADLALAFFRAVFLFMMSARTATNFFSASLVLIAFIDIVIGVSLWQGRTRWRTWALARAVFGLILQAWFMVGRGTYWDLVNQASFSGAMILVLTGESNRNRTWIAIIIYVVGYVGTIMYSFLFR